MQTISTTLQKGVVFVILPPYTEHRW